MWMSGDFGALVNGYGGDVAVVGSGYDPAADFNFDGRIDVADFGLLVNEYGTGRHSVTAQERDRNGSKAKAPLPRLTNTREGPQSACPATNYRPPHRSY